MRPPILYQEGASTGLSARFGALLRPAVIDGYQPMIADLCDAMLVGARVDKAVDLSRLSMRLAVRVIGRVVGLTNSSVRGMSARLGAFFEGDPLAGDRSPAALLPWCGRGVRCWVLLPDANRRSGAPSAPVCGRDQPAAAAGLQ